MQLAISWQNSRLVTSTAQKCFPMLSAMNVHECLLFATKLLIVSPSCVLICCHPNVQGMYPNHLLLKYFAAWISVVHMVCCQCVHCPLFTLTIWLTLIPSVLPLTLFTITVTKIISCCIIVVFVEVVVQWQNYVLLCFSLWWLRWKPEFLAWWPHQCWNLSAACILEITVTTAVSTTVIHDSMTTTVLTSRTMFCASCHQ